MRRAVLLSAFLLLTCRRELPTEPLRDGTVDAATFEPPMIRVAPDPVYVHQGSEVEVVAYLTQDAFTYPTPVPLYSRDKAIATLVGGSIPPGQKSWPMKVRGIVPGETDLYYVLTNFGWGGHSDVAARVIVTGPAAPPTPVVPVKVVTMEPNPIELKTGQEMTVRMVAANTASADITFKADTRNVVEISGKIAAGRGTGTVTIRAIGAGNTNILYVAGEQSGIAGRATVEDPPPSRRRSSRS
jgi:hypothetical protein